MKTILNRISSRVKIYREDHIGFGIRWDHWIFKHHISIAFPFYTISIGIGERV